MSKKEMELVDNNGEALSGEVNPPETEDQFDQSKDADFSNIKLGGRHFAVKAPEKQTEGGIILSDEQRKEVQSVQDLPSFSDKVVVSAVADKCELVEKGDKVLLSPHIQAMEFAEQGVLYLLIHEDYVLATKKS